MYNFFKEKKWRVWAYLGGATIIAVVWYKVQLDVKINEWFGTFYDMIQKALSEPGSVSSKEIMLGCLDFGKVAGVYIIFAIGLDFFSRHWVFRWRQSMNDYYVRNWDKLRLVEGASQRIQEDAKRFSNIMESLGVELVKTVMTLLAFLPLLWTLSEKIEVFPIIGKVDHGLVWIAICSALIGTVLLRVFSWKLPGLEFENQKVEAAYRKELVHGEDSEERCDQETADGLFKEVRKNYFRLFFHYMYFDLVKWSYLQGSVLIPYLVLSLAIAGEGMVAGTVMTLGLLNQITRAFSKVEDSFQYLVRSYGSIIELQSIHKRLRTFEKILNDKS